MPLWQSDDYIHYRENLIEEIGFTQQDVPREWVLAILANCSNTVTS